MGKSKSVLMQVLICIGLLCLIWGGYYVSVQQVRVSNERKAIFELEVSLEYDLVSEVEEVVSDGEWLTISGWAMHLNSMNNAINVVLQPMGTMKEKLLETESIDRKEMADYFVPNWDKGMCGFVSKIKEEELDNEVCYEILLSVEYETLDEEESGSSKSTRKKIATNQYLYNNGVYRYNPIEFRPPSSYDVEIQKVIERGNVRLYSKEMNIWIYQYDTELYFISEAGDGTENGIEIVYPIMAFTSRPELLPDSEISYEHLGFYEEKEEYDDKYRVGVITLPTQYPITYINTGVYDFTDEKWIQSFCIDVDYESLY